VKTKLLSLFLCAFLVACAAQPTYSAPKVPDLKELKLTNEDWRAIQQIASFKQGYGIRDVQRVAPNAIQIEYDPPRDRLHTQGPAEIYEKSNGVWRKMKNWHVSWAVS